MALCPMCNKQFNAYVAIHPNANGTLCCSAECACGDEYAHDKRIAELEAAVEAQLGQVQYYRTEVERLRDNEELKNKIIEKLSGRAYKAEAELAMLRDKLD